MKNSILEKARWLREVALATSKNNGARVAREWLKYAAMFVMLFTIGSGNAWGETVTYKQTSTSAASVSSGAAPKGSNVTFSNTYSTKEQLTRGNNMVLTLTSLGGINISNITLSMKSNKSGGAGKLSYSTDGGKNWTYLVGSSSQGTAFNNAAWNGSYTTSYKDVSKDVSLSNVTQLKIRIEATANSLYCQSFTITYETISCTTSPTVTAASNSSVTATTATVSCSGGIESLGEGCSISSYGFVIGKSSNPEIGGSGVTQHEVGTTYTSTGVSFSKDLTGLTAETTYYVRPYATNGNGTAYGTQTSFTTSALPKYTVNWYVNGSIAHSQTGYEGATLTGIPTPTSSDCDGNKVFVGWYTSTYSHASDAPAYVSPNTIPNGGANYYAVFATASGGGGSSVMSIDFEGESSTYSDWTFTNLTSHQTGSITAKGGTYYGTTGGKATASVTTKNKIASPTSLTAYVSKETKNTTSSTWYIRVSSDLSTWTNVTSQSATSMTKGNWVEMTADLTAYSDVYVQVYYNGSTAVRNIDDLTLTIGGGTTYSAYSTSCQACVAPTSVTITGTNKYLGGQTISLTAAPEGGTGTPSYQWQKKISEVWTNLENDGSISGVTSNNLQISSCSYVNSGGYRCIVSTGGGCETKSHADDTNGYGVHVFSIHGKYTTDADYSDTEIIWTSETTGTATIHLNAKKTYLFKVWSNNGYYYGHGAKANEDFMFQPTTWDCGTDNREMRLFTTVEGDYTFTVNIEHGLDGSPYVNLQVGYPSMTHPNTGYVYVQKFSWTPRLHYWYNDANKLTEWNDDPSLASDQYVNICGTDYWCVPVIDYYCNFIAADHNGQTTGDQHTNSPHPGQRLYNDGSWKWGEFSTYTIAYAGGDGSTGGPMASHTGLCPGSSQQLTANAFSKSGYNFSGWTANVDVKIGGSTVPAGTLITGTPIIENVQSNITLTAQWRDLAQYHVTFSADNGTVAGGASQTVTEGGTLTFPNVTSTTCGTFSGWVEAAYDNTAAPSGATYHAVGDELAADPSMDGKTYYAVYHVAMGAPTTTTDVLVYSDFNATGSSYVATNNLRKSSAAVYEAVTAKQYSEAFNFNKISDARGIVTPTSGGVFKSITLTTNTNHSATRKVYVYGSSSYTAAYADPAAFNTNSEVRGTLLATLAGDTKTYSTSTDDYEYIAIFADGAAYLDQISLTWYGAPMKYQTSPTCSPMVGVESNFSTFTYAYNAGPSASQSFTISGSNLGADLVVTAPANYEVCKTADGTYTSTISYTPSDGAVANTTAYIRLAAGLNVGTYNYEAASGLQVTSTGAKTRTAALNGSVTKADCAITFTDFNAVDHYEATLEYGSRVTVSYNYTYNGDGNFSISRSPATGTIDNANKTLTVSTAGIWTLNASATAGTNYSKPSDASAQIRVKCVDTYKDFIHNKTIKVYGSGTAVTDGKMEDWGSGYTVPYIEDNAEETSGSCQQTHYKFMGWVSEDDINIADGTFKTGWTLIQAGTESKLATTKTYYAVWAKLEE